MPDHPPKDLLFLLLEISKRLAGLYIKLTIYSHVTNSHVEFLIPLNM